MHALPDCSVPRFCILLQDVASAGTSFSEVLYDVGQQMDALVSDQLTGAESVATLEHGVNNIPE